MDTSMYVGLYLNCGNNKEAIKVSKCVVTDMIEFKTRYQKISLVDTALLGDCKQTK